jgi:hypothetical protein
LSHATGISIKTGKVPINHLHPNPCRGEENA